MSISTFQILIKKVRLNTFNPAVLFLSGLIFQAMAPSAMAQTFSNKVVEPPPPKIGGFIQPDLGEPGYLLTGPHPTYTVGLSTLRLEDDDVAAGGTLLHQSELGDQDTWSDLYALPFPFQFYGQNYSSFSVSKTGLFTFTSWAADQEVENLRPPEPTTRFQSKKSSRASGEEIRINSVMTTQPAQTAGISLGLAVPEDPPSLSDSLPLTYLPPATIAFFYDQVYLPSSHRIRGFLYGSEPFRQLWIVNMGQKKRGQGKTYTALVLEETTHRIMAIDMMADEEPLNKKGKPGPGYTVVGIQRNTNEVLQLWADPVVPVVGETTAAEDNVIYLFQPDDVGSHVQGEGHESLSEIDAYMANYQKEKNIPGMTVAVSKNGRLVFSKGYGWADVEQKILMQDWHRAQIGSVTKMIAAVGAFRLQELLGTSDFSLDMPLYGDDGLFSAPEFEGAIISGINLGIEKGKYLNSNYWWDRYHEITPRHLLTHTSGFSRSGDVAGTMENTGLDFLDLTYKDIHLQVLAYTALGDVPAILSQDSLGGTDVLSPGAFAGNPSEFKVSLSTVGTRTYSNHGFGLLGYLIAEKSGMPFQQFTREYVLDPIGLEEIVLRPYFWDDKIEIDAKQYRSYSGGSSPYTTSYFDDSRVYGDYGSKTAIGGGAAGSWVSSARDMVKFMTALDGLNNQSDILFPDSLVEMESIPFPNAKGGQNQPHGWDAVSTTDGRFSKNGKTAAGVAQIYKYPDGISVAVIINAVVGDVKEAAIEVHDIVAASNSIPPSYDLFESSGLSYQTD